ncbi:MAG TPA: tetratricopeptide repeat protein [Tepidisphaeraceae bacterium]|nr:tetratricopeptide repeat protein [Tepidisphaeraceae bacterium]
MTPTTIQQAIDYGLAAHRAGRLHDAELWYRHVLMREPEHPDALHLLGVLAHQVGRNDEALPLIRRAIEAQPQSAALQGNLGLVLLATGNADEAISACRRALEIDPQYADACNVMGNALLAIGSNAQAAEQYRRAIELRPTFVEAHSNLGNVLSLLGDFEEAERACRRGIEIDPNHADAHNHLGNALYGLGRPAEAAEEYRRALALRPGFATAQFNLGVALYGAGDFAGAAGAYRAATAMRPDHAIAQNNLANTLYRLGCLDEAMEACRHALRLQPDYALAYNNLGNVLRDQGRIEEAVEAFQTAVRLAPQNVAFHTCLLFSLHFHPSLDAQAILREHQAFDLAHIRPLQNLIPSHPNSRDAGRRLKIGYVSADFRGHAMAAFTRPLLESHDRGKFEIFCYSNVVAPDTLTETFRGLADTWRDTANLSDAQLADLIAADAIDILVDLTMHMAGGRPLVFARKPAPVQAAWLAYPGTTGISTMDYRLTDPHLDPPGHGSDGWPDENAPEPAVVFSPSPSVSAAPCPPPIFQGRTRWGPATHGPLGSNPHSNPPPEYREREKKPAGATELPEDPNGIFIVPGDAYAEQSIRLPDTFWCYSALEADLSVGPLPADANGYTTFGSLNSFSKVNAGVQDLWAKALRATPDSRLLVLSPDGSHRERMCGRMEEAGIDRARIEFVGRLPWRAYMELNHRIDIVLDTFPYNGHTTSLDALWMGVPLITLRGQTAVGRAGAGFLTHLDLPDLIARGPVEYVNIATALAADVPRLQQLRATLRQRMESSPLMDASRFAANMEAAYQMMWEG